MVMIQKKGERFYIKSDETLKEISDGTVNEIARQYEKWGEQLHSPEMWMVIIQEEFGEVAQEVLRGTFHPDPDKRKEAWYDARKEIIETIACLAQLYHKIGESLD